MIRSWKRPLFGLQIKIATAFILVLFPAFLATGYLAYDQAARALKNQKQEDELVMAKNIAAQVEEVLTKARKTVEVTATLPEIKSSDPAARRSALTLVIKVTELLDGLILWDMAGRPLTIDSAEPDTHRLFPDSAHKRFVRPCLAADGAVISDVYRSKTGEAAVGISVPVRAEGKTFGVLTAGILLNNHSMGGMEEIRIGKSGYAYLVDGLGQIIVHPQQERLFEDIRQNPPVQEFLKSKGPGVTDFVNSEGIRVVAAHAPVGGTGWGVIVRQPASESYVYVRQMFWVLSVIFVLFLALSIAAAIVLAWRIGRPVADLARGVGAVAAGNLDVRVPVATGDELGDLARAFNEMTARLRRQREEAAAAERALAHNEKLAAVGQLAAGIAHEIHNPLNIISGFAEHLRDSAVLTEKARGPLEDIVRETDRCRALVANLLGFARQSPPRKTLFDMATLLAETVELVAPRAKPQNIFIDQDVTSGLPPIEGDRDQIKQILLNLLFNACQAMPEGGRIEISLRAEGEARAILTVRDTGPGVPPENLRRLFTPFFTTKDKGTGLGLALSYSMAERNGGALRAENHPAGGALFALTLPLAPKEAFLGVPV